MTLVDSLKNIPPAKVRKDKEMQALHAALDEIFTRGQPEG